MICAAPFEENQSQWRHDLLRDAEVRRLVQGMLTEKRQEFLCVKQAYDALKPFYAEHLTDFTETGLALCLMAKQLGARGATLRSEIMRMTSILAEVSGRTVWESDSQTKYRKATEEARIADTVRLLVGDFNERRNIPCPFHSDKSPSMHVYTESNRFHCFGCAKGGSPVDFVMLAKDCSFWDAVEFISTFL